LKTESETIFLPKGSSSLIVNVKNLKVKIKSETVMNNNVTNQNKPLLFQVCICC